jgi:hypothetical protein
VEDEKNANGMKKCKDCTCPKLTTLALIVYASRSGRFQTRHYLKRDDVSLSLQKYADLDIKLDQMV